jgi:hypothetical protein
VRAAGATGAGAEADKNANPIGQHAQSVGKSEVSLRISTLSPFTPSRAYMIYPSSRALSLASFHARAKNSARVIGPLCSKYSTRTFQAHCPRRRGV